MTTAATDTTTRSGEPGRPFTLRLDPGIKHRLRVDAARHGVSMNEHLGALLDEHLPAAEAP